MIVMKFGGSSVQNAAAMRMVAEIIKQRIDQQPLIVLSALGGITDQLIRAFDAAVNQKMDIVASMLRQIRDRHFRLTADLILEKADRQELDQQLTRELDKLEVLLGATQTVRSTGGKLASAVLSVGELLSSNILNAYLCSMDIKSCCPDARKFIILKKDRGEFVPDEKTIEQKVIRQIPVLFENHQCIVTQGFIGSTSQGTPATLGRDGSDYTASLLGAVLQTAEIQIWSDVDGILSADPSIISYAKPLKYMTFDEACELAYFGARVLHPATIQPALENGIPVRVLNSHFPEEEGTLIVAEPVADESPTIKSIAYKEGITLLTIESSRLLLSPKIMEEIFQILTNYGKRVYAVSKSATKLSFTIENHDYPIDLFHEIEAFGKLVVEPKKVIVSVVGEKIKGNPVLAAQIMEILEQNKVHIDLISQFTNLISFTFIIDEADIEKTVKLLHQQLIERQYPKK